MEAGLSRVFGERVLDPPDSPAPGAREQGSVWQEGQASDLDDLSLGEREVVDDVGLFTRAAHERNDREKELSHRHLSSHSRLAQRSHSTTR